MALIYIGPFSISERSRLKTKSTKWMCAQRRLRTAFASAQSSLCTQWVDKDPSFLYTDSEDSNHTGRMLRLIWVFDGRTVAILLVFIMRRLNEWSSLIIASQSLNPDGRWRWNNTFPPFPVFRCPQGISKLHPCSFPDVILPSPFLSSGHISINTNFSNVSRRKSRVNPINAWYIKPKNSTCKC